MNILKLLPTDQVIAVLQQDCCEIDLDFMGFTEIYEKLAEIIPFQFTVIDIGCSYAAQAFLFKNHKRYIGVDPSNQIRFHTRNTIHYYCSIQELIELHLGLNIDLDETFAICSYVPDAAAKDLVRKTFKNLFVFYPSNKSKPVLNKIAT